MIMTVFRIAFVVACLLLLSSVDARAQESLAAARDLYASAQYVEALNVLDRLSDSAMATDERQSIDLYRTLCLLAVGRREDAERAIEAIIARDPLYQLGEDLSPRARSAFAEAKQRVLPAIVQEHYNQAKDAFDRKEFEVAAAAFQNVIDTLNDPDLREATAQSPLSDLKTLAVGFHDLSVKAIPPPPPPPPPPPAPEPVVPVNLPPRIYNGDEPGVRAPVTISQDMPRYPGIVPLNGIRGVIEIVIDEKGDVESSTMVVPVSNSYDKLLATATSKWHFQPATHNGEPVKFRKRIQIFISPPTR